MILDLDEISNLSFPDSVVINSVIDLESKIFEMKIDFAWLDIHSGKLLKNVLLRITDWQELILKRYDSDNQKWYHQNDHNSAFLKDICEFEVSSDLLVIKGFSSYNGQWHEWGFKKANVVVEFG